MKIRIAVIAVLFLFFANASHAAKVAIEELNGSDLGMGVGARAIGMGGAFTALADDASAMFWNPAGLTLLNRSEAMLMIDQDPIRYTFKSIVFRPEEWRRRKSSPAIGIAQINRLKYIGQGHWAGDTYAQHLVDLSMIAVDFTDASWQSQNGGINSRTVDNRISAAWTFPSEENTSIGINYVDFECVTTFYGAWNGRACQIVAYKTIDLGILYRAGGRMRFGAMLKNPFEKTKPRYLVLGSAFFKNKNTTYTLDIERIFGNYSSYLRKARFLIIRAGMERSIAPQWKFRAGIILPLQASTSTLGNIRKNLPSPKFGGAIGFGYSSGDTSLDAAIYGDPGRSYVEHDVKINYTLTVSQKF